MGALDPTIEELAADERAPRLARDIARRWAERAGWLDRADDLILLVSELVANAVVSATGGSIRMVLSLPTGALRCEVTNNGDGWPVHRVVPPTALSGRGLHLVDQLASRWGSVGVDGSTVVWFELDR